MTARTQGARASLATRPFYFVVPALLAVGLLAGCTTVPGIRTQANPSAEPFTPAGADSAEFTPSVRTIDASLLAGQQRERSAQRSAAGVGRKALTRGYQ